MHTKPLAIFLSLAFSALAASASAPGWSIPFSNTIVSAILPGKTHAYLLFEISRGQTSSCPLIVPSGEPLLRDVTGEYDMNGGMTCVDLRTGRLLWTRLTPGRMRCAVDPETDDLCLWREHLFVLDAKDGHVVLDLKGDRSWQNLDGIIRDGRIILQGPALKECLRVGRYPRVYDPARETIRETDAFRAVLTSPDGKKRISPPLQVREVTDQPPSLSEAPLLWAYKGELSRDLPLWHGNQVLAASGRITSKGVVRCLDGLTGKEQWSFTLPRGLCSPGSYQLRNGSYPPDSWGPVAPLGGFILAIDGSGQMFFLNATNGQPIARCSLVEKPMHFPLLLDDLLIVSDHEHMQAVPLSTVLNPQAAGPGNPDLLRAETLAKSGKAGEAESRVLEILSRNPDWPRAWEVLGDLYQELKRPQEELACRCRVLALTGKGESPRLRESWGLLRRITLGEEEITAPVALFDGTVYAGTKAGGLWSIHPDLLAAERLGEYPADFTQLVSTRQLTGNNGLIREERCSLLRPVEPEAFKAFTEKVQGRTPVDNIILSSTDGTNVAFVRRHWPTATLEIWSRDGERKIRTEELRRCPNEGALLPFAGGFLVTGDDLVWASCDSGRKSWLFGARTEIPHAVPLTHYQNAPNYGLPVAVNGRLFVGCRDGAVYVFDIGAMTGMGSAP